ncbi:MAG TPA: ubiquinol-cytochrome c reductase iron-sulfur subunit [Planctomycetota bacterium]|jgi:cytochrome b6-f complex iron-sulfur subunit|nr:ubiquinol-cytochrome c reductase iron-sulfur subunit [Planctomycetota bacterium]
MADPAIEPKDAQKRVPQQYDMVADYPPKVTRRSFMMSWAGAAWGTFGLASGVGGFAMLRFMLPNVLFEPPQVFKAGKLEDYEFDKPDERFKVDKKCWIIKLHKDFNGKPQLAALDTTCTHLGCTPNVLFSENKIKCPCHGSGFRFNGINFEGPTPRPLERYKVSIDPVDGQIVVDKTKKYQWEKGQWEDKDSFISL